MRSVITESKIFSLPWYTKTDKTFWFLASKAALSQTFDSYHHFLMELCPLSSQGQLGSVSWTKQNLTSLKNTTWAVFAEGTPVPPRRLIGTSKHTTDLPFGFSATGKTETELAEETPDSTVGLIGPAEAAFFDIRSPETGLLLSGFMVWFFFSRMEREIKKLWKIRVV